MKNKGVGRVGLRSRRIRMKDNFRLRQRIRRELVCPIVENPLPFTDNLFVFSLSTEVN